MWIQTAAFWDVTPCTLVFFLYHHIEGRAYHDDTEYIFSWTLVTIHQAPRHHMLQCHNIKTGNRLFELRHINLPLIRNNYSGKPPLEWVEVSDSTKVNRRKHEAEYFPAPSADVDNAWSHNSTSPCAFTVCWGTGLSVPDFYTLVDG
jgi:hypothetical protein